eukprot:TRINITY_DN6258_c0_g1_i5.p1 TRINITY_DN6258_c0_g1~~TRINITY_DN6258_c0_g1_i5.p1  ORF type:complete len:346 (+),score=48.05 TRINITY_DN6258_c0_g1_i5:740-1777(+)
MSQRTMVVSKLCFIGKVINLCKPSTHGHIPPVPYNYERPVASLCIKPFASLEERLPRKISISSVSSQEEQEILERYGKAASQDARRRSSVELKVPDHIQFPNLERVPSAGRRKGVPKQSVTDMQIPIASQTERPQSRRAESRRQSNPQGDGSSNHSDLNTGDLGIFPVGQSVTLPSRSRATSNSNPAAPLTLRSLFNPSLAPDLPPASFMNAPVLAPLDTGAPLTLASADSAIPPWEVGKPASFLDSSACQSSRPSSVSSQPMSINDIMGFSYEPKSTTNQTSASKLRRASREHDNSTTSPGPRPSRRQLPNVPEQSTLEPKPSGASHVQPTIVRNPRRSRQISS